MLARLLLDALIGHCLHDAGTSVDDHTGNRYLHVKCCRCPYSRAYFNGPFRMMRGTGKWEDRKVESHEHA